MEDKNTAAWLSTLIVQLVNVQASLIEAGDGATAPSVIAEICSAIGELNIQLADTMARING